MTKALNIAIISIMIWFAIMKIMAVCLLTGSPACRYNVKCVNKLCQFRYTKNEMHSTEKEDDKSSKKDNEQETVEVESMENVENGSGVESCGFCGQCLMILTT